MFIFYVIVLITNFFIVKENPNSIINVNLKEQQDDFLF